MPVDSNKFGSSSKMSGSGGSSSTGSCASVSELRSCAEEDTKSNSSSGICSSLSVDGSAGHTVMIAGGGDHDDDDDFDAAIEESMEMLEKNVVMIMEASDDDNEDDLVKKKHKQRTHSRDKSVNSDESCSSSGATTPSTEEESYTVPLTEEDIDRKLALFNQSIQTRSPEGRPAHANHHHVSFPGPPPLPPTIRFDNRYSVGVIRRRLSQCKEEENEEEEQGAVNSALVAAAASMRKSSSLNTDSTSGMNDEVDGGDEEKDKKVIPTSEETVKVPVSSRFTVTKTESKKEEEEDKVDETVQLRSPPPQLRLGVEAMLRNTSARQNSQTIHFPCSTPVQSRQSVQSMFEPHLDKRFFDSSLVEIRSMNDSTQTVNEESLSDAVDAGGVNDVWVKRSEKSVEDVSLVGEEKVKGGNIEILPGVYTICGRFFIVK